MSLPRRSDIVGLDWDGRNEQHVEEHIAAYLIDEMIEGGDWFAFPNSKEHPPQHRKFVGRTPSGMFVTAIMREVHENPGFWRPITGWHSSVEERRMYRAEAERKGRRHGQRR